MSSLQETSVVVFDLDDTLYLEKDYRASGFKALANFLAKLYQLDKLSLEKIAESGGDVLQAFANEVGCGANKESLLWFYRLHSPDISLSPCVKSLLGSLEKKNVPIVILTDGRSITQRLKMVALGLDRYPFFISEEFGGNPKPNHRRFRLIEEKFPGRRYIYVGDNVAKDFVAPNELGWISIGLRPRSEFILYGEIEDYPRINSPQHWINHLNEIEEFL